MKILAVIPARAGSKGIPNKNIRIIGGRPMIYYVIRNAQQSKNITDIIVSTDSAHVKLIAEQMGVEWKHRSQRLCGDDVTLDEVVYDAVPQHEQWDYIVTMQPTSPTLSVHTLDDAIQFAIVQKYDTVISAINSPHLSWGVGKDGIAPNYLKRLNRQFLPSCFVETGAFLISRAEAVTQHTRIGRKVTIYEVPEDEALDIDTFYDLQHAAWVIEKKSAAIYVNGNMSRGLGHIYRALELADEFYLKPDIYYDFNQTNISVFGKTAHNLIAVNGISDLFERCRKKQYRIFINDILSTSIDYMIGLRLALPDAKIINFEDDGEGSAQADMVFNALYSGAESARVKTGEKYYIPGKLFLFYLPVKIRKMVERVFISFGGTDPQNYSDRLLEIISKPEYSRYRFTVVLGRGKQGIEKLMEHNARSYIEVFYDVPNMPALMSECDIAVTSRGRTCYELAMLGIPSIAMSQNTREEKHEFVCENNGFCYIGLNPDDGIIENALNAYLSLSQEERQVLQDRLLSHDLRGGRRRVMGLISSV